MTSIYSSSAINSNPIMSEVEKLKGTVNLINNDNNQNTADILQNTNDINQNTADILQNTNDILENTNDILILQSNTSNINSNLSSSIPTTTYKLFPDNMLTYLDFTNPDDLGKDVCGSNNGIIYGNITHIDDLYRKHAIQVIRRKIYTPTINTYSVNASIINLNKTLTNNTVTTEFSISLWFKLDNIADLESNYVISLVDPNNLYGILVFALNNVFQVVYYLTGVGNVLKYELTNITTDAWHHLVITSNSAGNKVRFDNVAMPLVSGTGNATTVIDITTYNRMTLGGHSGLIQGQDPDSFDYARTFSGWMSDFTFWNRSLTVEEINMLYNDDYGYLIFPLAGQSNMVSHAPVDDPSDVDYSLMGNRVYQYKVNPNLNGPINAVNLPTTVNYALPVLIDSGTNNLSHIGVPDNDTHIGLWKTFCDNLIQHGNIHYRRKVLLIPVAKDGSAFSDGGWRLNGTWSNICISAINNMINRTVAPINGLNSLGGFLWYQGESEITTLNMAFLADFTSLIIRLRSSITHSSFKTTIPIIVCEILGKTYDTHIGTGGVNMKSLVNDGYDSYAVANTNCRVVKTVNVLGVYDTLTTDPYHNDAPTQRQLGLDYFNALMDITTSTKIAFNDNVVFNDDVVFKPNSIYTNLSVNGFYTHTLSLAYDAISPCKQNIDLTLSRFGNFVFVEFPLFIFTTEIAPPARIITFNAIPVEFRPKSASTLICGGYASNNPNVRSAYCYLIATNGVLTIERIYCDGIATDAVFEVSTAYRIFAGSLMYSGV